MASISSITQQYAKRQQQMKQQQKGGAFFDFLKSEDNSVPAASSSENIKQADPKPAVTEGVTNTEDKSMIDTIKEKLNIGNDTDTSAASAPAPAPAPPPAPVPASSVKEEEKPGILSGLLGMGSNKDDEKSGEENQSEVSEESDGSEDISENTNDFDMIAEKMSSLREKYDKLKADYDELKSKTDKQNAEEKKLDESKVTTLIAAFTASQGALTAFKEALIEHLKNNNYPLDGLDLSEQTSLSQPIQSEVSSEKPDITPIPESNFSVEAPAFSPPAPIVSEEAVIDNESGSEMSGSESESESESGSESESEPEPEPEPETVVQEQPERVIENESTPVVPSLPEVPVNEMPQSPDSQPLPSQSQGQGQAQGQGVVGTSPIASPVVPSQTNDMINGGRSHYVHADIKRASTHRRHKRRNRHQTLRNYKK